MAIETVLLDAGSVLVHPNWYRVSETLKRHGVLVDPDALFAADPHARFAIDDRQRVATTKDADRGSLFFRLVFERAGVPPDAPLGPALEDLWAYHGEHNLWEYLTPDVMPALERLAALGVTMAVASNANGALQRMFDRVGLTRYFHAICDSCVEGAEKPDPRFFQIVLQRAGGRPQTAIHVGDLYHVDVAGARAAGLRAILFDPHGLYDGYDVERIRTLDELVDRVDAERSRS